MIFILKKLERFVFRILNDFVYCFAGQMHSAASSLSVHVNHIVFVRTDKQMGWIYATSIIAGMKDRHAFGDFASVKNPGHSMCSYPRSASRKRGYAVPISFVDKSNPFPARFPFFNVAQKTSQGIMALTEAGHWAGLIAAHCFVRTAHSI